MLDADDDRNQQDMMIRDFFIISRPKEAINSLYQHRFVSERKNKKRHVVKQHDRKDTRKQDILLENMEVLQHQ